MFHALANPQRLAIFVFLVEGGRPVRQSEIRALDEFSGYNQSTVSAYLKDLVADGLIEKAPGKRGAYFVPSPSEAISLLDAAAAFSEATAERARGESADLRRRLRKAKMRLDSPESAATQQDTDKASSG